MQAPLSSPSNAWAKPRGLNFGAQPPSPQLQRKVEDVPTLPAPSSRQPAVKGKDRNTATQRFPLTPRRRERHHRCEPFISCALVQRFPLTGADSSFFQLLEKQNHVSSPSAQKKMDTWMKLEAIRLSEIRPSPKDNAVWSDVPDVLGAVRTTETQSRRAVASGCRNPCLRGQGAGSHDDRLWGCGPVLERGSHVARAPRCALTKR